jgi:transposase, IS30 family
MAYHQITSEERYMLSALRRQGLNQSQIAQSLGRHRSSISRELRRNSSAWDGGYRPFVASHRTRARRSRSRRNHRFTEDDYRIVNRLLRKDWSPEQIAGRLRKEGALSISHETIYVHVWNDKAAGGGLYKHLRCASKKRRKRHNSYDSRGRLAGKRHISERPAEIETRRSIGHWEIDTVVGGVAKDCVATVVERKTGYSFLGKLFDRSQLGMSKRLKMLIRRAPSQFATMTSDNGTEFHDYESVEAATGVQFFFATPYHSWERGSNENFNGLLRQYLPKRASQADLTQRDCDAIAKKLNTRPRKRLGYRTPEECFLEN